MQSKAKGTYEVWIVKRHWVFLGSSNQKIQYSMIRYTQCWEQKPQKNRTKYSDCLYLYSIKNKHFWQRAAKEKEKWNKKDAWYNWLFWGEFSANFISNTHAAASGIDTDLYHFYLILPLHKGKRKPFKIQHILKRTNSTLKNKVIIRRWKTKHFNPLNPKNLASAKDCLVASSYTERRSPIGTAIAHNVTWDEMKLCSGWRRHSALS